MRVSLPIPEVKATINCIADLVGFKDISGIYCIYSEGGKLLYVGKSQCLKNRLSAHFGGYSNMKDICHMFYYAEIYEMENGADRDIYETYMINKLKPLYNVDKVYFSRRKQPKAVQIADNQTSNAEWLAQLGMLSKEDIEEYERFYRSK
ncbi:nucleotide excision repair endonuclease [Peribacillus frigoritolerans]|uniref:nucleotide excision repair endonuclease n=1 Tax=Peribacillus frigoritolerans TaxID=450367 RepID=UPI0035D03617